MTTTTAIGRDARGHFLPGSTGNAGGRPSLPDWFKSSADDCLRVLVACATGRTQPGDPPAAADVAANAETKDRIKAAELVCNRVLGKAPETITVDGQSGILDVLIALAKPVETKGG